MSAHERATAFLYRLIASAPIRGNAYARSKPSVWFRTRYLEAHLRKRPSARAPRDANRTCTVDTDARMQRITTFARSQRPRVFSQCRPAAMVKLKPRGGAAVRGRWTN